MSKNNEDQVWSLDSEEIEQLRRSFELAQENESPQNLVMPTRASMKRRFLDLNPETFLEMQETMEKLDDQFGVTSTKIRHLSQDEVDTMVEELMTVRKFNDILSSREEALKTFAKNI